MSSSEQPFLLSLFKKQPDEVLIKGTPLVDVENETGVDRLRKMFSLDQYGYHSKEFAFICQTAGASTFGGGVIGAIIHSRDAYVKFLENNQATKFQNHMEAKRELQRVMYVAFSKGAFRWAWRIGGFSFSFVSLMTITSVYFGRESVIDYVIAAGLTGGLFRANMGLKGMVAGSVLGSFLGVISGTVATLVLKTGGTSLKELSEISHSLQIKRDDKIRENIKEHMVKEYTDFVDNRLNDDSFKTLEVANEK